MWCARQGRSRFIIPSKTRSPRASIFRNDKILSGRSSLLSCPRSMTIFKRGSTINESSFTKSRPKGEKITFSWIESIGTLIGGRVRESYHFRTRRSWVASLTFLAWWRIRRNSNNRKQCLTALKSVSGASTRRYRPEGSASSRSWRLHLPSISICRVQARPPHLCCQLPWRLHSSHQNRQLLNKSRCIRA